MSESYQVFLSHSPADQSAVERLAHALLIAGMHPWFDRWHLPHNQAWAESLEGALGDCPVVVACLGGAGDDPWASDELGQALMEAADDPNWLVLGVFLPGAPADAEMPDTLADRPRIDLRRNFEAGVSELLERIREEPDIDAASPMTDNPYVGLRPYGPEDAWRFFGRHADVEALLNHLRRNRLLALLGPGGTGRSSILGAGLVPAVATAQLDGSYDWRIATVHLDEAPLEELAQAIFDAGGKRASRLLEIPDDVDPIPWLAEQAGDSPTWLHNACEQLGAEIATEPRLLVWLVGFETFMARSLAEDDEDTLKLIANVLHATAVEDGGVHVVLSLRPEDLDACAPWPEVVRGLGPGLCSLPGLLPGPQAREAAHGPARLAGTTVDESVLDDLARQASSMEFPLPRLQHLLWSLWGHRDRETRMISWSAYEARGKLDGAISCSAEQVYGELDDAGRLALRELALGLDRGPISEAEASGNVASAAALVALAAVDLVNVSQGTIRFSSPVVPEDWARLRTWAEDEEATRRLLDSVAEAARVWHREGRPHHLLWQGFRLDEGEAVLQRTGVPETSISRAFIEAGRDVESKRSGAIEIATQARVELHATRAKQAERTSAGRGMSVVVSLGLAAAALVGVQWAVTAKRDADLALARAEYRAVTAENGMRLATARLAGAQGAPLSQRQLLAEVTDPEGTPGWREAVLEALATPAPHRLLAPQDPYLGAHLGRVKLIAHTANEVVIDVPGQNRVHLELPGQVAITAVAVSADERWVALGTADGRIVVRQTDGEGAPNTLGGENVGHRKAVTTLHFSPDGRHLVSGGQGEGAWVWAWFAEAEPQELPDHPQGVIEAQFSPNGKQVLTLAGDGTVRIWDAEGVAFPAVLTHETTVHAVGWSPGSRRVVTGTEAGDVWLWNTPPLADGPPEGTEGAEDAEPPEPPDPEEYRNRLGQHDGAVHTVVFSAQGDAVVTGSADNTLGIWTVRSRSEESRRESLAGPIELAGFSPDGTQVVTASGDGSVQLWPRGTRGPRLLRGPGPALTTVAFSPQSDRLLTLDETGIIALWPATVPDIDPDTPVDDLRTQLLADVEACVPVAERIAYQHEAPTIAQAAWEACVGPTAR